MAEKKEVSIEEAFTNLTKRVALLEQTAMSIGLSSLQNLGMIDANKMVEGMKKAADEAAKKEEGAEETKEEEAVEETEEK